MATALMFSQSIHPHSYGGHYTYPAFNPQQADPVYQLVNPQQFLQPTLSSGLLPASRRTRKRQLEVDDEEDVRRKRRELEIPSFFDATSSEGAASSNDTSDTMMADDSSFTPPENQSFQQTTDDAETESSLIGESQSFVPVWPIRSMKDQMLTWMAEDHKRQMKERLEELTRSKNNETSSDDNDKQLVLYQPIIPPAVLDNLSHDNVMADS